MKRFFKLLVVVVLLLAIFTSCRGSSKSLVQYGKEVIFLMSEMIENDSYLSLYTVYDKEDEQIKKLRQEDFSKVTAVYDLALSAEWFFDGALNKKNFSENLYNHLSSSAYTALSTMINQAQGVDIVSVAAIFTASKTFDMDGMTENKLYLYLFKNATPILVAFIPGEDGSFRANGSLLFADEAISDNVNAVKAFFQSAGVTLSAVKVQ